uniref:Protein-tyrosine-phosphatase n=1 Tax=Caenorhabditis japonica TaxID=281687 RepID=A0A8R1HNC0_CAEJA
MNRFTRKKHEATNKSKPAVSSQSYPPKKKIPEPKSESDSKSERPHTKTNIQKKRTDAKEHRKSSSTISIPGQKIVKAMTNRSAFSPGNKHKGPGSRQERKVTIKLEKGSFEKESDKTKLSKEMVGHSIEGSSETVSDHNRNLHDFPHGSQRNKKLVRSERSLIGLDGETELEFEKKNLPKKIAGSPCSMQSIRSQEESSASETKESISLADDEETRDAYRRLLKEFAMVSQKMTLDDFKIDFAALPGDPSRDQCVAFHASVNAKKNRYTNIPCLDSSRVRLTFMPTKNLPGNDYIHANFIKSPFLKRDYILSQGPKKETIADFWRMVWQEKSTAIVMLCQFVETNREKCFEYFPRNANCTLRFDKLTLSQEESVVNKSMVTTRLKLQYEGEARIITHFQWKEWPDYQVPGSSEVMLKILRKIRARSTPPIIHCAAGVGRSGTLMAIEISLQAINSRFQMPDVRQIVSDLRTLGRAAAVQTLQQYMLIWKVVLDFGVSNKLITEESMGKFSSTYRRSLRGANSS